MSMKKYNEYVNIDIVLLILIVNFSTSLYEKIVKKKIESIQIISY